MNDLPTGLPQLALRAGLWRRDIHRNAETAFEEVRTAALVASTLEDLGLEVHRGIGRTGVVGVLRKGKGTKRIGLRADMDAIFTQEENDFGHRSVNDGRFHGCGHDGHTAMLLGAAEWLARRGVFDGEAVFIFQPAEENEGGARAMIEDGLFDRFDVDEVYALHNGPGLALGSFSTCPGAIMSAFDHFEIVVEGRGTHAGIPHGGIDPIVAGSQLVSALQSIVARNVDPIESAVVSTTQFQSGDTWNVIPQRAVIRGCTRTLSPAVRDQLEATMRRVAKGVCEAHGATASFMFKRNYPATVNTPRQTACALAAARAVSGAGEVNGEMKPWMTSEDFGFMLQEKPGCYVIIGNGVESAQLHNPRYDFNDQALGYGVEFWIRLVQQQLPA